MNARKILIVILVIVIALVALVGLSMPYLLGMVVYDLEDIEFKETGHSDLEQRFYGKTLDYEVHISFHHDIASEYYDYVVVRYIINPHFHDSQISFERDAERLVSKSPIGSLIDHHIVTRVTVEEFSRSSGFWEYVEEQPISTH